MINLTSKQGETSYGQTIVELFDGSTREFIVVVDHKHKCIAVNNYRNKRTAIECDYSEIVKIGTLNTDRIISIVEAAA